VSNQNLTVTTNKRKWWKVLLKVLLITGGTLTGLFLILFLILWSWSPGRIEPFLDDDGHVLEGSISEIVRIEIGGTRQGMIIRGRSVDHPVILFLHGGPGNPTYAFSREFFGMLEDYFTVVHWEQRGAGMSYGSAEISRNITVEQMVSDTAEITNYLRERFEQDTIYLMGHSWGTFLGIQTIARHPELFEAYLGVAQVSNGFESEVLGHAHMLSRSIENDDRRTVDRLSAYTLNTPEDITTSWLMLRSDVMNHLGNGVFHEPFSQFQDLLLPVLQAREYTLSDKFGFAMGSLHALNSPANAANFSVNLMEAIPEVEVPVFIFHGIHDRQVSYELSRTYFDLLQAPEKHFFTFYDAAHTPFMEEPEKFMEIILHEVLAE